MTKSDKESKLDKLLEYYKKSNVCPPDHESGLKYSIERLERFDWDVKKVLEYEALPWEERYKYDDPQP